MKYTDLQYKIKYIRFEQLVEANLYAMLRHALYSYESGDKIEIFYKDKDITNIVFDEITNILKTFEVRAR